MIPFKGGTERQRCTGGREILPGFSSGECSRPVALCCEPPCAEDRRDALLNGAQQTSFGTHLALDLQHGSKGAASPAARFPFSPRARL